MENLISNEVERNHSKEKVIIYETTLTWLLTLYLEAHSNFLFIKIQEYAAKLQDLSALKPLSRDIINLIEESVIVSLGKGDQVEKDRKSKMFLMKREMR